MILLSQLFLPIYSPQARREFGSVGFVMCNALTALSMPRASFLRTWAIYVIMWTRHRVGS